MANNVYIGSRYVPIFDGDWDSTKVYEPLTIVNYNGGSYTSKRTVTAGTLPTNTNYWALTGNYNGQIANLQTQLNNLETEVENYHLPMRMVVITDSYGAGRESQTPFTTPLQTYLGLSNSNYFAFYEGAMGFYTTGHDGHNAATLIQSKSGDITNHNTITHIIFALGINDISVSAANIISGIDSAVSYCRTEYPNAEIYIGYINNTNSNKDLGNYLRSIKAYNTGAATNHVKYLAGIENIMHDNSLFLSDLIHPTTAAGEVIAEAIVNTLLGKYNYIRNGSGSGTGSGDGASIVTSCSLLTYLNNDVITIKPDFALTSNLTISDRNYHEIATFSNNIFYGQPNFIANGHCKIYCTDGAYHDMIYTVYNSKLYIMVPTVTANALTLSASATFYFEPLTIPTLVS